MNYPWWPTLAVATPTGWQTSLVQTAYLITRIGTLNITNSRSRNTSNNQTRICENYILNFKDVIISRYYIGLALYSNIIVVFLAILSGHIINCIRGCAVFCLLYLV